MTISARHAMPTNINISGPLKRLARGLLSRQAVWVYWIINVTLLVGLVIWICRDGQFPRIAQLAFQTTSWKNSFWLTEAVPHYFTSHVQVLQAIIALGGLSALGILVALFAGSTSSRSLRAWLGVMFLFATWSTAYMTWPDLAWRAQAWRLRAGVPALEEIITRLSKEWPSEDGQLPEIGPFTAYSSGLMLLKKPRLPGTQLQIATIGRIREHGGVTSFRVTMGGNEDGAELFYFPVGSWVHHWFKSQGRTRFDQYRQQALGKGWFLVETNPIKRKPS